MGDQVGVAVSGTLYYVPFNEFERVRALQVDDIDKTALFAALCRINTLYMIASAGSGHIGSSFSSMDIMSWLQLNELRTPPEGDTISPRDIFFSSKGHDAPGLYNTFIGMGKLDFDLLHRLRRLGGLPGHPDVATPNIITNTGSLGMGVSKAKGMVVANRLLKRPGNVFVLTGDGELQAGQFWESLVSAANQKLHEITVIIDHNKLQSDTLVSKVSDLGDLEGKLAAFGWYVDRCDGNDLAAFSKTLAAAKAITDRPKVIIADTIKGKGVSFMEHTSIDSDVELYKFHSGAPGDEAYARAAQELIDAANAHLETRGATLLELETVVRPVAIQPENPQRLIQAYSNALLEQARKNPKIVALDADLILDTGLIPFQKEFPDRFIECGIAEQDMVSQAGGLALQGLLPVVHSFACFLSTRPNEHIYNNATERRKVIYTGAMVGILPSGPGHSHQSVRDIAALTGIPGFTLFQPSCEREVGMALDWAVNENMESTYLRVVNIPCEIPFDIPNNYRLVPGQGVVLRDGEDAVLFAYGPIMLAQAWKAAVFLHEQYGIGLRVVNQPWLNRIDREWLAETVGGCRVLTLDDHYVDGGMGAMLAAELGAPVVRLGLTDVPACGTNEEVLRHHGLDAESIVAHVIDAIR